METQRIKTASAKKIVSFEICCPNCDAGIESTNGSHIWIPAEETHQKNRVVCCQNCQEDCLMPNALWNAIQKEVEEN